MYNDLISQSKLHNNYFLLAPSAVMVILSPPLHLALALVRSNLLQEKLMEGQVIPASQVTWHLVFPAYSGPSWVLKEKESPSSMVTTWLSFLVQTTSEIMKYMQYMGHPIMWFTLSYSKVEQGGREINEEKYSHDVYCATGIQHIQFIYTASLFYDELEDHRCSKCILVYIPIEALIIN